jgi:hypothetical protein
MVKVKKSELLIWLESIDDPNELARSLIESGAIVDTGPDFVALVRRATFGKGEYSRLLEVLLPATKASRSQRLLRYERIKKHHPALEQLTSEWKRSAKGSMPASTNTAEDGSTSDGVPDSKPRQKNIPSKAVPDEFPEPSEWDRQFLRLLKVDLYENNLTIWPHLYGPHNFPPPPGYVPSDGRGRNPFAPPPKPLPSMQPSLLSADDAWKVFDGVSFAMWKHGKVMNAHVIIVWSMIRGIDAQKGMEVLGLYLNEARKWLSVGSRPRRKLVANPRSGEELHYVWVHENVPGRGFHSHILMHLPFSLRKEFDVWSRSCLVRLCKTNFDWKAFRIVPSYAKDEESKVRGAWRWYRYITKQLNPAAYLTVSHRTEGVSVVLLRDVLNPWRARTSIPLPRMKRAGVSHSIGRTAQKNEGFSSKLRQGSFDDLYQGKELHDRRSAELLNGVNAEEFGWQSQFKS